jgi:DNA-binding transcriptional regulator LsrR (DeoR family)
VKPYNNINMSMLKSERDKILLKVVRKFYKERLSKTDIANELKISVTHVNRMLQEASEKGIVRIAINAPRFEDLEIALSEKYHLHESIVVDYTEDETYLRIDLGHAAATYFDEKVSTGKKVGIGSGRSMYEMVSHIEERPRRVELYPLNVMTQRGLETVSVDANSLVNTLWFKSRPEARAFKVELFFPYSDITTTARKVRGLMKERSIVEFRQQLGRLDFYFFSVSELRPNSVLVALAKEIDVGFEELKQKGIIGDCIFNTINAKGDEVPFGSEELTLGLSIGDLVDACTRDQTRVVCVAGGLKKREVLQVALERGAINVLITDREVAAFLLRE